MVDAKISDYIMGLILFTLVIVGTTTMMAMFNDNNPTFTADPKFMDFNKSFNKLDDLSASTSSLRTSIEGGESNLIDFSPWDALISTSWNTLTTIFNGFSFGITAFEGLSKVFQVPEWVIVLITSAIVIIIGFAIWGAIFQKDL